VSDSVQVSFEVVTDDTPSRPHAKRGDSIRAGGRGITETDEQLSAGLIWWPCSFCNRHVLVSVNIRGRERCKCGAVRCHSQGQEGWRRDGKEWWFI